jgi:DNA-binding response OmpR family regulator
MKRILIVEDDKAILRGLVDSLKAEHFDVETSSDGKEGYQFAQRRKYDLLLLDVMLPNMNGFEICRQLRADKVKTPILMLTGKGEEIDKVMGLELGADDYVTKPFSIKELLARIKALMRRQTDIQSSLNEASFGDCYVDFKKQEARKGSKSIDLTSKEFQLLKYLVEHEGEVISRDQLLDSVWGYDALPTTRTVDNYILSLRKKIESNPSKPKHILTIHTAGYKFKR